MKLPFGLHNGNFIHISEVTSGRTEVLCPYCQQPLIAKKGKIKRHHFAHDGEGCTQHFANNFFGIIGKLPTDLPLSIYALKKKAKINAYLTELRHQESAFLNKNNQKETIIPALMNDLARLAKTDATGNIEEITEQVERFIQYQIAPFPEFHLIRNATYTQYTDGKRVCNNQEIDQDINEFFYPKPFSKYVKFLKNYHSSQYEYSEVSTKLSLFQKDLTYFNKFDLYFLEIIGDGQLFYKIGLTSRSLENRLKEIEQDLKNFYLSVGIKPLFVKNGVAFIETFFKQKYESKQFKLGELTEYFNFKKEELVVILKDLNLLNFESMPERSNPAWVDWQFFRFNGKIYGYQAKSIYVAGNKVGLTDEEALKLEALGKG